MLTFVVCLVMLFVIPTCAGKALNCVYPVWHCVALYPCLWNGIVSYPGSWWPPRAWMQGFSVMAYTVMTYAVTSLIQSIQPMWRQRSVGCTSCAICDFFYLSWNVVPNVVLSPCNLAFKCVACPNSENAVLTAFSLFGPKHCIELWRSCVHSKIVPTIHSRISSYNVPTQSLLERMVAWDLDYHKLITYL